MRHFYGTTSDIDVVVIVHRCFTVFAQRAVHHYRGEAELNGALANSRASTVVLMHHDWNMREFFNCCQDQVAQEGGTGIFPRASRGLHDNRRVSGVSSFHDGAHLLKVINVECWNTVAIFGCVVEHLAHADQSHGITLVGLYVCTKAVSVPFV